VPSSATTSGTSTDDDILPPRSKQTPISAPLTTSLVDLGNNTRSTDVELDYSPCDIHIMTFYSEERFYRGCILSFEYIYNFGFLKHLSTPIIERTFSRRDCR
jgi:hypothetical protein